MKPAQGRTVVRFFRVGFRVSERRACRSDPLEAAMGRRWLDEKGPGHDRLVVRLMAALVAGDPAARERLPYLVDTTVLRGAMEKGRRRAGRPAGERKPWG